MKQSFDLYIKSFKKYAVFKGRASRREFWSFWAFHIGLFTMFSIFSQVLFTPEMSLIYLVFAALPAVAVTVRRMHDTNRSGWWAAPMLTIVGVIIPFYFALKEGQSGANEYGLPTVFYR